MHMKQSTYAWLSAFCAFSDLQLHPYKIITITHNHFWKAITYKIVRCDGNIEET
jgi:hypothetical protein